MSDVWRLAFVSLLALVLAGPAAASRAPTRAERLAIMRAVRSSPGVARGVRLSFERIRISTVDARYAYARTFARTADGGPIGEADWVLHRVEGRWRVAYFGTEVPPCKSAPRAVRRDLLGTTVCLR